MAVVCDFAGWALLVVAFFKDPIKIINVRCRYTLGKLKVQNINATAKLNLSSMKHIFDSTKISGAPFMFVCNLNMGTINFQSI